MRTRVLFRYALRGLILIASCLHAESLYDLESLDQANHMDSQLRRKPILVDKMAMLIEEYQQKQSNISYIIYH